MPLPTVPAFVKTTLPAGAWQAGTSKTAYCFCLLLFGACGKDTTSIPSFRELPSPSSEDLTCVAFSDSLHGSLTGGKAWEKGFILNSNDGGLSWHTDTLFDRKMEHVCFDQKGQGYACGQDVLWYLPLGEVGWRVFHIDWQWLRACHFPDGLHGVVAGGGGYHGGMLRRYGEEYFWQSDSIQHFQNEIESVWYSDSTTVHAVGFGWVMRSNDAGRRWARLDITGDFFQSVQFPTPSTGYICGSSGTILKTTDGGQHWQEIRKGGSIGRRLKNFRSLWFANPDKGWVVGDGGIFWQTDDGGDTWHPVEEAPSDADFTHIFLLGKKGWVTAKGGRLFAFEF